MFLSLSLVFLSLSLDTESHIFRMFRWLPVIRFYFVASKGIDKLKVRVFIQNEALSNQDAEAKGESTLTSEDRGFKQLVSLLRNEGSIQKSHKVEKLIMHAIMLRSKEHLKWLNMVVDGKEEFIWGSSEHTMVAINELIELNKKRAIRKLTNIMVFVAVLLFVLNSYYVIWMPKE